MNYICDILPKDKHSISPRFNLNFLVPDGNISSPSDAPAATNFLQGDTLSSWHSAFLRRDLFFYILPMQKFSLLSCSPPSQGEERELILPESRGKREKGKEGSPLERIILWWGKVTWGEGGKEGNSSCKLQDNVKIKPQIKWVRIYISLPEEKITLGKWKGTVDTKKLKLLSGKICRAGSRYMVAAGRK